MKVLVACEESAVVREAFAARGHEAVSCDLLPTVIPGEHYQGDVFDIIEHGWDMMIAFPPCTAIAVSGNGTYANSIERREGLAFVARLMMANIPRIAIENPVGIISTWIRKPDQYIQPWQFGHGETKKTGLWLQNLPLLVPTNLVAGREQRVWRMAPSPTRSRDRSRTYPGIAQAMAEQWGSLEVI